MFNFTTVVFDGTSPTFYKILTICIRMHGCMYGPPVDSRSDVMGLSRATPLLIFINSEVLRKLKTKEIGVVDYTVQNTTLGLIQKKNISYVL